MKFSAACIAICLLLCSFTTGAANNYWSRIGPFGGGVFALKFNPAAPSGVLAVSYSEIIYSGDGGNSWNAAYFEGNRVRGDVITVTPSRSYVYTQQSALLSSTDGGQTWTGKAVPYVVSKLEADAQDSGILYAKVELPGQQTYPGSFGIIKSADAGASWTLLPPISAGTSVYDVLTDPQRSGIVYAGIAGTQSPFANAYYKSIDGGATWQQLNGGLPDGAFATLSIDTSHPDTLYMTRLANGRQTVYLARSTDGGGSWQVSATNLQPGPSDAYFLIPDPVRYGTLYIGTNSGFNLFRSTDGGTSWSAMTTGARPSVSAASVVPHPTQAGLLFATTPDGLFKTSDDGSTWTEITSGFSGRSIETIAIDEPRLVVKLRYPGPQYFATTDQADWLPIDVPDAPISSDTSNGVRSVGILPWSSQRYAVTSSPNGTRTGTVEGSARLFRSDDDGATWTSTTITGLYVPDLLHAITNDNPPLLIGSYYTFACGAHGCFVAGRAMTGSSDGGVTWQKIDTLPAGSPNSVASSPTQPSVILVAQDAGIVRSADGGRTFQRVPFTETITGGLYADPHHPGIFYSATQSFSTVPSRLYRSVDAGLTWTAVELNPPLSSATGGLSDMHFNATRPERIDAIAGNGLLFRSENAGLTWTALSPGPGDGLYAPKFGRHEPSTAYFVTSAHGIDAYTIARDVPVDVVEFHNMVLDHYFMTAAAEEAIGIDHGAAGPGWARTGFSFKAWLSASAAPPGVRPVCRFYGTPGIGPNSHFYTIDPDECAAVQRDPGWTLEATDVYYLYAPSGGGCSDGKRPVDRAYNNRYAQNDSNHRYASDPAAYNQVLAQGWRAEGLVMCAEQ